MSCWRAASDWMAAARRRTLAYTSSRTSESDASSILCSSSTPRKRSMATDTGFDFANSKSPNRASNTGTVMMCWAIISTASCSVMLGFSES